MTLREAAQQALEALLRVQPQVRGAIPVQDVEEAINALRAALAKPERRYSCPICAGSMVEDEPEKCQRCPSYRAGFEGAQRMTQPASPNDWHASDMGSTGMTLRDYFAAAAMQGLIASGVMTTTANGMLRPFNECEVADQSYRMAEVMLVEREKKA